MKTKYFILAALAGLTLASCSSDEFLGDNSPNIIEETTDDGAIRFGFELPNATRTGEFVGATAAEKLGRMFVVEGTKGSEQTNSPSTTVVFDNYLVGYEYNSAGKTESNTNNWEYVGKQTGIDGKLSANTWKSLHSGATDAQSQSIKYWDYSTSQYDFIAWSTGTCEAVPVPSTAVAPDAGKIQVSRINQVTTTAPTGFTMRAASATDLKQCYYTDVNKVLKANYGVPVTLTFRNMAAKVRVALYETVPGYSVKDVKFYSAESDDASTASAYDPTDLATAASKTTTATLFTTGDDKLPQSGIVTVLYPRVGSDNSGAADYNKASVTVTADPSTVTTQTFGALTAQYVAAQANEGGALVAGATLTEAQAEAVNAAISTSYATDGTATISADDATAYNATLPGAGNIFLGRTLPTATFAGDVTKDFYEAVIPNTNGKPLTLRVDYTLVPIDGAAETINVYGAKAVVPATYTNWLPNYAYTYIFKISDNTNGWTSQTVTDPQGLFPITFDAVVTSFTDANAEQTTVTTVATPSITTYQQGHTYATNEYSKSQKAGVSSEVKDVYVQVMNNSGATPTLVSDLNGGNKSLLFAVSKATASEAEVMDALQNRTSDWDDAYPVTSPVGRNGITLTTDGNIDNTVTEIVNGVDDQKITKIAGTAIAAGQVAKIDIDQLAIGTYAYVYCETVPSTNEKIYNVVSVSNLTEAEKYYQVSFTGSETPESSGTAVDGWVYFIENLDAENHSLSPRSFTFVQTKVGVTNVTGLYAKKIPNNKASSYATDDFYFDVYNQNNGKYAVKVIKVVDPAP